MADKKQDDPQFNKARGRRDGNAAGGSQDERERERNRGIDEEHKLKKPGGYGSQQH